MSTTQHDDERNIPVPDYAPNVEDFANDASLDDFDPDADVLDTLLEPDTQNATSACEECQRRFAKVCETVRTYFPELLPHFIAALTVCAILVLKKGWKPLALVFE